MDSSAKVRIAAVTPEPHEVIPGWSRSTPASVKAASMRARETNWPFSTTRAYGTLNERGIWPDPSPGRGSAALLATRAGGPRLGRLAGEAVGRPRIDHLHAVADQRHSHVRKHRHGADIHLGSEFLRS